MRTALVALLLLSLAICCAASDIQLSGVVGYENQYRPNTWTPVTVKAVTRGAPVQGQIVIDVSDDRCQPARYVQPITVTRETFSTTIQVLMPYLHALEARFVVRGRTQASVEIGPLRPMLPETPLALNLTGNPSIRFLNGKLLGVGHTPSGLTLAVYPLYSESPAEYYRALWEPSGG